MTKIQEDIFNSFDPKLAHLEYDSYDNTEDIVVIAKRPFGKDAYDRCTISPEGDATIETFVKTKERSVYGWSMEEHGWMTASPVVKAGDEPFDEAVNKIIIDENKMKEIKEENKMARTISDYIEDNLHDRIRAKLRERRDEINDKIDEKLDSMIDEAIDNYMESYEYECAEDRAIELGIEDALNDGIDISDCDLYEMMSDEGFFE